MAIDLHDQWFRDLAELRFASTPKRVRAFLGDRLVLDSRDAMLVYEPRCVVPWYAVPPEDIHVDLVDRDLAPLPEQLPPVLAPFHPEWHTTPGRALHLEGHGEVAFRPDDPSLDGRVVVPWGPFTWFEEEDPVMGHPRDPFKRIDVLRSSRHVRVEVDGVTIAESRRPSMLLETSLPVRWYLPRDDVRMDLLTESAERTVCAYKGVASYLDCGGATGVAWFYPDPLHDAVPVRDHLCFWGAATVLVDGSPVSTAMPDE